VRGKNLSLILEAERMKNLQKFREKVLKDKDYDTFCVTGAEDRYWLSGFYAEDGGIGESSGFLFITQDKAILATDPRYSEQAMKEAVGWDVHVYTAKLSEVTPQIFEELGTQSLGFDERVTTYSIYKKPLFRELVLVNPDAEIIADRNTVEKLRMIKTVEEIRKLKIATLLTESVMETLFDEIKPGMTEKEIGWLSERYMRERGAEKVSFTPLIASGPNVAMPHHHMGDRKLGKNDFVLIDMGAMVDHYCADMTRMFFTGEPTPKMQKIYGIAYEANIRAMEAVKPGATWQEVDAAARDFIKEQGYGENFTHSTGHGIGLQVHELPLISPRYPDDVLEEDMVFSIEPGIYLTGWGGMRVENLVRVTAAGYENLNDAGLYYWR
jgi:Xaa-Pro aminopeptidase